MSGILEGTMTNDDSANLILGKEVDYPREYNPKLLCPVPRSLAREAAGIDREHELFFGEDLWNIYELSWLDTNGRPKVAMGEFTFPLHSPNLIESKSLKLYCNSFNMHRFPDETRLCETLITDLSAAAGDAVSVKLILPDSFRHQQLYTAPGICIDQESATAFQYDTVDSDLLHTAEHQVEETLFSRLFRSRCPVTGQPDWATVIVTYRGKQLDRSSLLQYLVSYREHQGFHEACVEQIFCALRKRCQPEDLTVTARFTRRGGLDINPVRSDHPGPWVNRRDPRQ